MHIGSDSKVFVDGANDLILKIKNGQDATNWNIRSDGDLWEHFHLALLAKSAQAVRVTKVKGHATQEHINQGVSNPIDKAGNDEADNAAEIGVKLFGDDVIRAARSLHERHRAYAKFMLHVAKHLIEGYMIHRALIDNEQSQNANNEDNKHVTYQALHYPPASMCHPVLLTSSVTRHQKHLIKHPGALNIETFIKALKVAPANLTRGITWIELYLHYRMSGFPNILQDPIIKSKARPSLARQMRAFKREFRAVVCRCMDDAVDQHLFAPGPRGVQALKGLAINGDHATVNCNVQIDGECSRELAIQVVSASRRISRDKAGKLVDGASSLIGVPFKGTTACDANIKNYALGVTNVVQALSDQDDHSNATPSVLAFYKCPKCQRVEPSSTGAFQVNDLDKKIKCKHCRHQSAIKSWTCQCKRKWHLCGTHSKIHGIVDHIAPHASPDTQHMHTIKCNKRKIPPDKAQSFESMCQEDAEHQARKVRLLRGIDDNATVVLGVPVQHKLKLNMLSPKLRMRFCSSVCTA